MMKRKFSLKKFWRHLLKYIKIYWDNRYRKYEVYNHPDITPIFNFWNVTRLNDLRYLIVGSKSNNLQKRFNKNQLENAYLELLNNYEKFNYELMLLYYQCLRLLYIYRLDKNTQNENKYNAKFLQYLNHFDFLYKDYEIKGVKYNSLIDYLKEFQKVFGYAYMLLNRMDYFAPEIIQGEKRQEWDLFSNVEMINEHSKHPIDIFTVTMTEYDKKVEFLKKKSKHGEYASKL